MIASRADGWGNPVTSAAQRRSLEEAIVDTVREPLIVLDDGLRVVVGSRSFYRAFNVTPQETEGRSLYELGDGQWNIPALRTLLEDIIPQHTTIEEFEVEHDFPTIGQRTMLLNARKVFYEGNGSTSLLVAIEDVTERRTLEREKDEFLREKDELLRQKDLLLQEMNHRVNNSLQIIASILLLKAQTVQSEEIRRHLRDAHERVMSVAAVQEQLHPTPFGAEIEAKNYLTRLCESLAASMILEDQPVSIRVEAGEGTTTSEQAVSMGLIATELVINALKHAFPGGAKGTILVGFESTASAWRLFVSDDGVGIGTHLADAPVRTGLGTSIVEALTRQLGGRVTTSAASPGTTVSVTVPRAA
jgi:two-component sensor histidine kinase